MSTSTLLADTIAKEIIDTFFLTQCKGFPDCGPTFLDDDDAFDAVRDIVIRVMANTQTGCDVDSVKSVVEEKYPIPGSSFDEPMDE